MTSVLRPLPAGTEFRGVVRFRNLHEDELGLLLWALRLDEDCYQSIGMGRSCGWGRMSVRIDELLEDDWDILYHSLSGGPRSAPEGAVEQYIAAYEQWAAEKLREPGAPRCASVRSFSEIQDFLYLHRTIALERDATI